VARTCLPQTGLRLALLLTVTLAGCDSSTSNLDGKAPGDAGPDHAALDVAADVTLADASGPDGCVPQLPDCTGLCGPVQDKCTGTYHFCGECTTGLACNLETHLCLTPLVTCADLKAVCGQVKNSCGKRIFCGYCPTGQECNPDTNTCIACTGATCQDLGYECGSAWLGCGPPTTKTSCGSCASGKTCNPFYSICDTACTPGSTAAVCAAANIASGVECGQISDGCGGIVDCGNCPTGTECGVRGVANRCDTPETPDECKARNISCGTIKSVCGGVTIDCGSCPPGEVCNTNGVCGPPCQPKTCPVDFAGQCGTGLDDGCNGKLTCKCPPNQACDATTAGQPGSCITPKVCADYNATGKAGEPCSNGPAPVFPKGDGTNLTCICTAGRYCVANKKVVVGTASGTCCQNTAVCNGTSCSVTNTCTGDIVNCCKSTEHCDSGTNKCVKKKTCADYTARLCNDPCSTTGIFPDGAGGFLTCNCLSGVCQGQSGFTPGTCCCNTNQCDGTSCTVTDSCTGATINCCTSSQCCDTSTNTCKTAKTCSDYTTRQCNDLCSTTSIFDNGCGGMITCNCLSGGICQGQSGTTPGACCCNTAACNGTSCTVTNTCSGATINCCTSLQYCDTSTNTCKTKKTCANYTSGQSGAPCSTTPIFPDDAGGYLTCPCASGGVCLGQSGSTPGTCCFNTAVCTTACTVTNTCSGATINCCKSTEHCDSTNKCVATTCATYSATGAIGAPCSTVPSQAFPLGNGTNLTCPCTAGGTLYNNKCIGSSATKAGACQCTPDNCDGRVGVFDDGCGGKITCQG